MTAFAEASRSDAAVDDGSAVHAGSPAPAVDLASMPRAILERMQVAGNEVRECLRVLESVELNLVGEVLRGHGTFYELEHYPPDDVHDATSHSQYYYHAHRPPEGEHGHFHAFLRAGGMPNDARPVPYAGKEEWPRGKAGISHLVAISMDAYGRPAGLFTTNRWVTAEAFYSAEQVIRMLDRFVIDHANPSWPVNRWIGAMLLLFRPQIEVLLHQRDRAIVEWSREYPEKDVYEDRALEITSAMPIDIDCQIAVIEKSLHASALESDTPARARSIKSLSARAH